MNAGTNGSHGKPQTGPHVQEVIRAAEGELQQLMQQRAEVVRRIGTIKQTLAGLVNIFGDVVLSDELLAALNRKPTNRQAGFTQACRRVLMEAARPLGSRQICQALQQKSPEIMARHKDPLASVTTVLNRLVDYAEARCSLDARGRRTWEWATELENGRHLLLKDLASAVQMQQPGEDIESPACAR